MNKAGVMCITLFLFVSWPRISLPFITILPLFHTSSKQDSSKSRRKGGKFENGIKEQAIMRISSGNIYFAFGDMSI